MSELVDKSEPPPQLGFLLINSEAFQSTCTRGESKARNTAVVLIVVRCCVVLDRLRICLLSDLHSSS